MKRYIVLIISLYALMACCPRNTITVDIHPEIFPDYKGVTVPSNIAPMNFEVISEHGSSWRAVLSTGKDAVSVRSADGVFSFGKRTWRRLLQDPGTVEVRIMERRQDGWCEYEPFEIYVATEEMDKYLTYRLIPPGYSLWREMSIRQRCLEDFDERVIYTNTQGRGNCVNCHSFCERDADMMLFHMRSEFSGTYLFRDGKAEKLDTKTDHTMSALVYPYWHPSGRYLAFSVNKTNQFLHTTDPDRIEVFDEASDVVVYDADARQIVTAGLLSDESSFETFPTFSPDGKNLYFCTAEAVEPMPQRYRDVRYSLCRVAFDPENCSFGPVADTLYNARVEGGSVSFPRISPDGRFLVFTLSDYGNFSIWHKEADLYRIDLQTGEIASMDALNSDDVESYHSWSGNSRWLVFSSRRGDGLYTRPYISYIDAEGQAHKPFLLPQKDPKDFYDSQMFSYNIPEFTEDDIDLTGRRIADFAAETDGMKVGFMEL